MKHAFGVLGLSVLFMTTASLHPALAADAAPCPHPEIILKTVAIIPYPAESQRLDETGTVMLTATVASDGTPTDMVVTHSSGVERLDKAASSFILSHYRWGKAGKDCPAFQQPITAIFQLGKPPKADGAVLVPLANYPADALALEEMGDTYLALSPGSGGAVQDIRIAYSSGFAELDNQAVAIARASPNLTAGKPSGSYVLLFRWKLPAEKNQNVIIVTSNALHMWEAEGRPKP